ncbi:MAG TPA: proton-conducting transporter membrane subunit [Tepidisphaeraceae bacterium]|nr:proton-conducting transporter membrane subunit [Tepidisphaeraceae bacterium]
MPGPVAFLILAALLPLGAFAVLLMVGRRMEAPLAGWIGTALSAGSFACGMIAMVSWYNPHAWRGLKRGMGEYPIERGFPWLPIGRGIDQLHAGYLDLGIYVDSLTVAMFAMVTLAAVLVHLFSIGAIRRDERYARFFAFLGLLCFSMLGLLLSSTLVQIFIFLQLLGFCTWLLIGFRNEKPGPSRAAIKAFIVSRIGDCGLLIGLGLLICKLGNTSLSRVWLALGGSAGLGHGAVLAGGGTYSATLLTLTGICLFGGAIARSAQFPLQTWLAQATQGPAAALAMVQTVTTTAAGIFLLARIYPILTPDARLVIAIVGVVTLAMGALIAVAQSDIQRVLAWSTVSQFGFMMLAIGVGSWIGALFLLITHAFVKTLLILGAGSTIAAARRERELPMMGGMWRRIPVTAATFGIGVLAMAGTPLLSIHYSQSMILTHAAAFATLAARNDHWAGGRTWGYWLLFAIPTATACLTAFYMMRCWMLAFAGKPRNAHIFRHAREYPMMWGPLIALAGLSVISGYALNVPDLLKGSITETRRALADRAPNPPAGSAPASAIFDQSWPVDPPRAPGAGGASVEAFEPAELSPAGSALQHGHALAVAWGKWAWLFGLVLGGALYWDGYRIADALMRVAPLRWARRWLHEEMFLDDLYDWTLVRFTLGLSIACAAADDYVIGRLLSGPARLVRRATALLDRRGRRVRPAEVVG